MYLARILTLSSTLLAKGDLLLNGVASCASDATPAAWFDRLALTSRLDIRFYK